MPKAEVKTKPDLEVIEGESIPHILESGEVGAVLEWIVKDKDGNITQQGQKKSESFVRQFIEAFFIYFSGQSDLLSVPVKCTDNVTRYFYPTYPGLNVSAGVGADTWGIRIGTGSTAPTINDYNIQSGIAHAIMNHGAVTFGLPASDASLSQFTVTRDFSNVSGGAVTVNEIALIALLYKAQNGYAVMIIRDVITGGIAVPNGQTLTINYRVQATI